MKKLLSVAMAALIAGGVTAGAVTASSLRVYINPGHGAWDSNSRPQNIVREVNGTATTIYTGSSTTAGTKPDTTAFYESNTNLWKCLATVDKLRQYGLSYDASKTALDKTQNIVMSRIKSGPYPVNTSDRSSYDKTLSTIQAEANSGNYDMFISVHSNANTDPHAVNYLALFWRGWSKSGGDINSGSRSMTKAAWTQLYKVSHHKWTHHFTNGDGDGVYGDISFYQGGSTSSTGYLGAIKHNVPGYLAEGYFHTYQPARQRAMQRGADVIEGYMYARGIADYFGLTKESTGDIYGIVRSATETFSHTYYTTYDSYGSADLSLDKKMGINNATVKLIQNGVTKATFTTDNHYNGAFVFTNIAPGTYTVTISKTGYKTTTASVTVTAATTTFPELSLTPGSDGPENALKGAPLNNLVEKWNFSEKRGTDVQADYDAKKIRNFCYQNGKLYCVYDHSDILVLNAQTGAKLGMLDKGDVVTGGTLTLCDVKAIDGKIVACNLAAAANEEQLRFYVWDNDNSSAQLLKTVTDLRGCARLGDCMEISGTWAGDMYITFCNDNGTDTQVVDIYRKGGATWGANVYKVLTNDGSQRLATSYTSRAYRRAAGFWIDGFNCYPTWCPINSSGQAIAQYCLASNQTWGTGFNEFMWGEDKYAASMIFRDKTTDSAQNYTGGRVRFTVNNEGNFQTPILVADYPSDGLSDNNKNGNTTTGSWINTDSSSYVELWVNSTNQGLCYYTYGTPPAQNPSVITPSTDPRLAINPSSVSLSCQEGETVKATLTLSGENLTKDITATLTDATGSFSCNKSWISYQLPNTTLEITYAPKAVGTHTATLTITSEGANTLTVHITATCKAEVLFDDEISSLDQGWQYSTALGNDTSVDWFEADASSTFTRDIEVINGKLYVLNAKAWNTTPTLSVIDGYKGTFIKSLSLEGINTSARVCAAGLSSIGGKLIMSNSANANHVFTVYMWDDDSSAPRKVIEDATHGGVVVGDQINTFGDLNNGSIWVSNGEVVLVYSVTNGTFSQTATQITLNTVIGNMNGSCDILPQADGTFWGIGNQSMPLHFNAAGVSLGALQTDTQGLGKTPLSGTAAIVQPFGERLYFAGITYLGSSTNMTGGAISLLDITNGGVNAHNVGLYPSAGLGDTSNTQFQTSLCCELSDDETTMNLWGSVPYQGIAYYKYVGATTNGISNVAVNDSQLQISTWGGNIQAVGNNVRLEVYSTSGSLITAAVDGVIDANRLPSGIYIVRAVAADGRSIARKIALTH